MNQIKLPEFHEAVLLIRPRAKNVRRTALVGAPPKDLHLRVSLLFMDSSGTERWAFDIPHRSHTLEHEDHWCWPEELPKAS